jgi:histidine triad (HIT) family protein
MKKENCIFCQIASGRIPAKLLYQDQQVCAFHDSHPIAPTHILIIPNQHIDSVNDVEADQEAVLGQLFSTARRLAKELGVAQSGYRLVVNTGPDAGQSVFHLHMHLIGGRHLPFKFE